jgi:hypothetical protein
MSEQEEGGAERLEGVRADFYRYERRERNGTEGANSIAIDKTTAMILGAIGSAAIAVAIAGGTALVQKVDDTAKQVDQGRAERIAAFGELSKNISIVETKLTHLITQISQLELRLERTMSHDLEIRDKRIDVLDKEVQRLQENVGELMRDTRRR